MGEHARAFTMVAISFDFYASKIGIQLNDTLPENWVNPDSLALQLYLIFALFSWR